MSIEADIELDRMELAELRKVVRGEIPHPSKMDWVWTTRNEIDLQHHNIAKKNKQIKELAEAHKLAVDALGIANFCGKELEKSCQRKATQIRILRGKMSNALGCIMAGTYFIAQKILREATMHDDVGDFTIKAADIDPPPQKITFVENGITWRTFESIESMMAYMKEVEEFLLTLKARGYGPQNDDVHTLACKLLKME